jgi:hypothetical protein
MKWEEAKAVLYVLLSMGMFEGLFPSLLGLMLLASAVLMVFAGINRRADAADGSVSPTRVSTTDPDAYQPPGSGSNPVGNSEAESSAAFGTF